MLQARNIPYKQIMYANTMSIAQKQYKAYEGDKVAQCNLCSHKIAQHCIVYYEDLPYAMKMLKHGRSEHAVNELVWQKAVREQQKGVYRAHQTLFVCRACVTAQLDTETGNPDIAKSYLDGIRMNDRVTLIIGRFAERPYHPALFFTETESVDDFMDQFRAQSLRGNVKRCSLPKGYPRNAL